ncbi:MAG: HAD family hydrolase, partial [Desulfobacterales bacterium]|nr:HAD family hydrolase [Desulfobacterales bacterium]
MRVYAKGAPEVILDKCDRILDDGSVTALSDEQKKTIQSHVDLLADNALRVLGFAYKDTEQTSEYSNEDVETKLVYIGLMGLMDPPREEVTRAIQQSKNSGIRPVMITGDHRSTAVAVAREVGILSEEENEVITGSDLSNMTDSELLNRVDKVSVYARVSPEHKVRIAQALRARGNIVAMTGDGVNDA